MSGNINFNGWINDDGSENYKCRAWVNFNGTGTVAIRDSGNVSSITDNGTGDYNVNFTTAMPDSDYAFTFGQSGYIRHLTMADIPSTTSGFNVTSFNNVDSRSDADYICVAVFR